MKSKILVAVGLLWLAIAPARADYFINQGSQTPIKAGVVGSAILPWMSPVDAGGNAFATLANPFAIQFGNGALLPQFASPAHFICDSGCSGGGSSGAVFGPTAVGTAAANPPVLVGGTVDGTAAGAVSVLKVLSGVGFINCANCSGSGISVAYGGAIGSVGTPGGFKDGSGNFQALIGDVTNGQHVSIQGTLPAFAATPTVNIGTAPTIAVTGTFFQATQPISAASLPLPTGAATQTTSAAILSALGTPMQNTGGSVTVNAGTNLNTSLLALEGGGNLASINTKTPALGQALAASSVPIVLTAAQLTTLTPLSSVTVTQATGSNLHIVCDSGCSGSGGTSSSFGSAFPAAGTAIGMSQAGNMIALTGTSGNLNVQCANCSGSGASAVDEATMTFGTSVFAPMGGVYQTTATSNPLTTGQQGMAQLTINRAVHMNLRNATGVEIGTAATPVQVSLANTAANGTALLVTGTGGTFPITAASLPLPAGASTAALQPTNAAQGSTTSGQTGPLMQAAVLTAAPTYITTQTSPLTMTTGGAVRVADASVVTALGSPFQAGGSIGNTTFAATQATASALNATVVGTGTFAVQATLQASSATAIGTVNPTTAANWGIGTSTQNSASVANGHLVLGQFNTAPTTITTGNMSPLQMDNAANLLVNIKASATLPVSVASSAVASGAYASGAFASGAFAAGSIANGANPVEGTITTAHGCLIAGYTMIGCLGQIDDDVKGPIAAQAGFGVNIGATQQIDAGSNAALVDPCQSGTKVYTPVNVVTATNVIIAGVASKKKYICQILLYPGGTVNFAVYQATTGTSCATAAADIFGGHTTGTGFIATAGAGFTSGNGASSIAATNTVNTDICITTSTTVQVSGVVVTVDR